MSCLHRCHQRHRVEEAVYFGHPTSRSLCKLNTCQVPCAPWPFVWLVRTHDAKHRFRGRELPDLSRLTQANRDTENELRWTVILGQNESERRRFANVMNRPILPGNTSQGPEEGQVIRFSQDLKMWCTEAIEKTRVQRLTHPGRPLYQHEPKLTQLALEPMKGIGLTAISE